MTYQNVNKLKLCSCSAMALMIVACGSGSNDEKIYESRPQPVGEIDIGDSGSATAQTRSWHFGKINYFEAVKKGVTGQNVLVGVVDTGIDWDSPFFEDNIHEASTRIWRGDFRPDFDDREGHGTAMASLIAGYDPETGLLTGVAPNAELLVIAADNQYTNSGSFLISDIAHSINYAAEQGVDIISLSLGSSTGNINSADVVATSNATDQGVIVINATGNNGKSSDDSPNNLASFAGSPIYNDLFVAVTATTSSDNLASFASPCDVYDPNFCISAPGNNVTQIGMDGEEDTGRGTSQATAIVAGSAALLKEYFPELTNEEIVQILLRTARDLGKEGVDRVFGVGLLDLEAALNPVGDIALANGEEIDFKAKNYAVIEGGVMGDQLAMAEALSAVEIRDEYDREFELDLRTGVHIGKRDLNLVKNARKSSASYRYDDFSFAGFNELRLVKGNLKNAFDEGTLHFIDRSWNANPYAPWLDGAVSLLAGENNALEITYAQELGKSDANRFLQLAYEHAIDHETSIGIGASYYAEKGSILGTSFAGAYGEIDSSAITAFHIGANWERDKLSAFARASVGLSDVDFADSNGFITSMDDIVSSSFAVGMGAHSVFLENDRFDIAISQPLRIESGVARLNNTSTDGGEIDLAPKGRELAFEIGYRLPLNENFALNSNLVVMNNPYHDAKKAPVKAFSVGLEVSF